MKFYLKKRVFGEKTTSTTELTEVEFWSQMEVSIKTKDPDIDFGEFRETALQHLKSTIDAFVRIDDLIFEIQS